MSTPKTLTLLEQHQLLDALLPREAPHKTFRKGVRNRTIALLLMDAGLRVGEVVALQMSDLYFGGVPVQNLLIRPEIAKNKTERTVPLSERIRNALVTYIEHWHWLKSDDSAFSVFMPDKPGHHLTTRQVERIIRKAAMKSIGRPVHPHMLRHTFGTKIERKAGLRITQELLGHKSITSTQIYTHPNEDDKKKAILDTEHSEDSTHPDYVPPAESASVPNGLNAPGTERDV